MFVLHPDGPGGGAGGLGSSTSDFQTKLWFFGKLGLYFGALHLLSIYMGSQQQGPATKSIEGSK